MMEHAREDVIVKGRGNRFTAAALLVVGAAAGVWAGISYRAMLEPEPIYPSQGLTSQVMLSDYFPALEGTPGDTEVFVFHGEEAGANVLIIGGVHANEPAGFLAAVVLVENLRVRAGKVVVIPRANASAFTCNDPQEGNPQWFFIETPGGGGHSAWDLG
jgi:hypothetical protein